MSAVAIIPLVVTRLRADAGVTAVYRKIDGAFGFFEATSVPAAPALFVLPIQERPGPQNALTLDQEVAARVGVLLILRRGGGALAGADISDFTRPVLKALRGWQPADLPGAKPAAYAGAALADGGETSGELRWLMAFDFSFTLSDLA